MAKISKETAAKISKENSKIKKLSDEQKKSILSLYSSNSPKMKQIEELVSRKTLFELTGDPKYSSKTSKLAEKADKLNSILFS